MKNFTLFKRQMMFVVFMLLGCMSIHAADDGLITEQITIKLDKAGTLPDKIEDKYEITNLKITGEINGTDLRLIRDMAGCDYTGKSTSGKLSVLDLSEAKIVSGGDYYFYNINYSYNEHNTIDDQIDDFAFFNCCRLTSLSLPSGIISIGFNAFDGCSNLTSLTLPSGITSIQSDAFSGCSSLTSLTLPSGITRIDNRTFYGCSSLTSLTLPPGITSIRSHAFKGCSSLTSLTLPSGITSIGSDAFSGCSSLTSLTLPTGITSIDDFTFWGCVGLTSLTLPSSVTSIGSYAFAYCYSLTSLTLPSDVSLIGERAFFACESLTSIYSYAEIAPYAKGAFYGPYAKKCTIYVPKGTSDGYRLSDFGYFENIVEFDATGIDKVTISSDAKELSRYSTNGQRLSAPTKGLNIVKYSDGSVKKVAVQ